MKYIEKINKGIKLMKQSRADRYLDHLLQGGGLNG